MEFALREDVQYRRLDTRAGVGIHPVTVFARLRFGECFFSGHVDT